MISQIYPSRHGETWPWCSNLSGYQQETVTNFTIRLSNRTLHFTTLTALNDCRYQATVRQLTMLSATNLFRRSEVFQCIQARFAQSNRATDWNLNFVKVRTRPTSRGHLWYNCVHGVCNIHLWRNWLLNNTLLASKLDTKGILVLSATHQQSTTSAIFNLQSYCPVITPNLTGIIPKFNVSLAQ